MLLLKLQAMSKYPDALFLASEEHKGDTEIVMKAVSQNYRALRWASDDLKASVSSWSVGQVTFIP